MKKKSASQLTTYDVHAFTDIVRETVLDSEKRVKNELKSYIDQKLEKQTGKFDQKLEKQSKTLLHQMDAKNREQTEELVNLMDKKNREQTDEICEVIKNVADSSDHAYVTKDEFNKHTSSIRAHQ